MTERTEAYANQFEDLSRQFIAVVERLSPEQMQALCAGEQCTVAALASHIAKGHPLIADWVVAAASGGPLPPVTMDDVHALNAEQFASDATRPKEEILAALRENGTETANRLRSLDDTTLDGSVYFELLKEETTADWLIQNILINELVHHPASIQSACEQAATT